MLRWILLALTAAVPALALDCDLSGNLARPGLTAAQSAGSVEVRWQGEGDSELRAVFGVREAAPVVRELAARSAGGPWRTLGVNLAPEIAVTVGTRRISNQQINPMKALGVEPTPEIVEKEKWKAFWDAPLEVPGLEGTNTDLPRKADEIVRAGSEFTTRACAVRAEPGRIEVEFDGLTIGPFHGELRYTVYRGSNLLRQEAIASTQRPSTAYHYRSGLSGFAIEDADHIAWRDVARAEQRYLFGSGVHDDPVALRARNRLAIIAFREGGSLGYFPPPHKFFWAREIEKNLGYVYYRKDSEDQFSVGVRQADHEEMYPAYGVSDEVWERRSRQARRFAQGNFALYNAPPGTEQRMAMYFDLSPHSAEQTRAAILRYTHGDRYAPLNGYQVAISHFHTHFNEYLQDMGSLDAMPQWVSAFRALGVNVAMMSDFHGDGHASDPGKLRFEDQKAYFEGSRRQSDRDFLLMPGEEPDAYLGGHYTMVFPRPVYWTKKRAAGAPFKEDTAGFGPVYHVGSKEQELEMLEAEGGLIWQAHPRTKGSTFYPETVKDALHFLSDRFIGASFQSLPVDLSEKRICEERCFGTLDDMNNWAPGPKYLVSEGDTYNKFPQDEIYPHLMVNYVKVDGLPSFDQDWSPITKAIRAGDFFVTSGEVLIPESGVVDGAFEATVEWTFPLDFVELVWGEGKSVDRTIVEATGEGAFGRKRFRVPFEKEGKKWVRFAAWDTAGNGAATQPVHLR